MCLQKMFTELVCFSTQVHTAHFKGTSLVERIMIPLYTTVRGAALWLAGRHYEAKIVDLLSCYHHQMKMPIHIDEDDHELEMHLEDNEYNFAM